MQSIVSLFAAGLLGGAMNAMAGGGSFVTLPALIGAGVPSVVANATSTVALYPGGAASIWVYRDPFGSVCGVPLAWMTASTLTGGLLGAVLLLATPTRVFDAVLPWLLLVATIAMVFGRRLGPWLRGRIRTGPRTVLAVQFLLGLYGGYYGGAVGLMMVAVWGLLEGAEIASLHALRVLLVTAANTIAVLVFAIAGAVAWRDALSIGAGAILGGVLGAHAGRRLPTTATRAATIALTVIVTALFFVRAYRPGA